MEEKNIKYPGLLEKCSSTLEACESRFRNIIQNSADGIIIVDQKGTVCFVNPAAEKIFNRSPQDLVGEVFGFPIVEGTTTEIQIVRDYRQLYFAEMRVVQTELYGEPVYIASIRDITDRKRTEEDLTRQVEINTAVAELSTALISHVSIEEISSLVEEHARSITKSELGYVGYIDAQTGFLVCPTLTKSVWDKCKVKDKDFVFKKFSGLWGWVLENGKPLLTNNPSKDTRSVGTPPGHLHIKRFLSVPAMIDNKLVGQVSLANSVRDYTDEDLKIVERLAGLYAIAIDRKRAEEKIKRDYYIQSTISSVLQISLTPIPIEEQLQRILDLILSIPLLSLQSKGCIYLVDEMQNTLLMKAQRNLPESLQKTCAIVPFGHCLCGMAALFGKIIHTENLGPQHVTHYEGMLPHGHYCVPIQADRKVLGVINLYVKEGHKENPKEEEFLSAVANTVAGIIKRKKSEDEKIRLQEQLAQYEKLSALGRLTANVAHEIRNPLTSLGGFARRLYKKIADSTREKEYCEIIVSEVNRLERILDNVLTFSKDLILNIKNEDISQILEEIIKGYEQICKERKIAIKISLNEVPQIPIDKEQIIKSINNILSNAIDSMPNGGILTITIGEEHLNEITYVVVKITDTGDGIAEDKLCFIFEPFFSTKAVGTLTGTGLGLSISRKIIEEHCGFIKAESSVGKGSTFSLYFPYQPPENNKKLQCWQFLKCGMEDCTKNHCPAYPHYGRVCWAIAGTYCGGKIEGTYAQKITDCKKCPFYNIVTNKKGYIDKTSDKESGDRHIG